MFKSCELPSQAKMEPTSTVYNSRYEKKSLFGKGTFNKTYLVTDKLRRNDLKILIKYPLFDDENPVRTISEVSCLMYLNHPNVLKGLDSFEHYNSYHERFFCVVTEFCENGDLDAFIRERRESKAPINRLQILKWLIQLADVLVYIHYDAPKNFVHNDLKPKNIFLKNGYKTLKLGEFSYSRPIQKANITFAPDTYNYVSPERFLKPSHLGPKSDCWSFACIIYELLHLNRAFPDSKSLELIAKNVLPSLVQQGQSRDGIEYLNLYKNLMRLEHERRFDSKQIKNELDLIKAQYVLDEKNIEKYLKWKDVYQSKLAVPFWYLDESTFKDLRHLRTLDLSQLELKFIEPTTFNGLDHLQVLDLSRNHLETIQVGTFDNLFDLNVLNLSYNKLGPLSAEVFRDLKSLLRLDLSHNAIKFTDLRGIDQMKQLVELYVEEKKLIESTILEAGRKRVEDSVPAQEAFLTP